MFRSLRLTALVIGVGALSFGSAHAQSSQANAVPLPENYFPALRTLIDAAGKDSPRMISRNIENAIAEESRTIARAGQLPTVGGFMQYNPYQRDRRADLSEPTDTKKFYYNVSLTQPLFHWGALRSNTRIGELQLKVAKASTAETYRLLVQEIRGLYLQLVLKKLLLKRASLNLDITTEQLSVAQTKFDKKVFSEAEMFMPRLRHDQASLSFDRVTADFDDTKRLLAKLTGTPALNDSQVADEIPVIPATPHALQSILAAHVNQKDPQTYAFDNMRSQIAIEDLNHQVATTRLKPKVNLLVGSSQDEQSYTTNIAQKYKLQSTYVGVQVNWTIFDGFATRSAIAISNARKRSLAKAYDDAVANLTDDLRAQYRNLEFSARAMEMSDRLLGSGQANLQSREEDLRRGTVSDAEVRTARLNFYDSQVDAFNSRFDYLMKTSDFLSVTMEDPALANVSTVAP